MGVGSAESGTFAVVSLKVGAKTVSIALVGAMALHSHYLPLRLPPPLLLLSLSLSLPPPLSLSLMLLWQKCRPITSMVLINIESATHAVRNTSHRQVRISGSSIYGLNTDASLSLVFLHGPMNTSCDLNHRYWLSFSCWWFMPLWVCQHQIDFSPRCQWWCKLSH